MLPAVSSVVRVSRRRSVTMLPFVVTLHSTKVRDTAPLSFVVTVASLDFALAFVLSSAPPHALMTARAAAATAVTARIPLFVIFMVLLPFLLISLMPHSIAGRC